MNLVANWRLRNVVRRCCSWSSTGPLQQIFSNGSRIVMLYSESSIKLTFGEILTDTAALETEPNGCYNCAGRRLSYVYAHTIHTACESCSYILRYAHTHICTYERYVRTHTHTHTYTHTHTLTHTHFVLGHGTCQWGMSHKSSQVTCDWVVSQLNEAHDIWGVSQLNEAHDMTHTHTLC